MSFWSPSTHPHTIYLYYSRESRESQLGGSQDFYCIKSLPFLRSKFKVLIVGYDAQRLEAEGEGDNRGWDGWMASPTQWTWVWVNSGSWWWTGGLPCCSPWGHKELDTTERLNWIDARTSRNHFTSHFLYEASYPEQYG